MGSREARVMGEVEHLAEIARRLIAETGSVIIQRVEDAPTIGQRVAAQMAVERLDALRRAADEVATLSGQVAYLLFLADQMAIKDAASDARIRWGDTVYTDAEDVADDEGEDRVIAVTFGDGIPF